MVAKGRMWNQDRRLDPRDSSAAGDFARLYSLDIQPSAKAALAPGV
jgi:hypothetical protein